MLRTATPLQTMQASDKPALKFTMPPVCSGDEFAADPAPPGSRPRNLILYIYSLPTKNIMGFSTRKGKEGTMNVANKDGQWQGFLIESKSYMSYATMSKRERVKFWLRVPFVWLNFMWMIATDGYSRRIVMK